MSRESQELTRIAKKVMVNPFPMVFAYLEKTGQKLSFRSPFFM